MPGKIRMFQQASVRSALEWHLNRGHLAEPDKNRRISRKRAGIRPVTENTYVQTEISALLAGKGEYRL